MSRNNRFPSVKLGELGSLLGEFKTTLIKAGAAAAEVNRQNQQEDKRRGELSGHKHNSVPPAKPVSKPSGPKPKLKPAALERLNTPLPADEKDIAAAKVKHKLELRRKTLSVPPPPPLQPKPVFNDPAKMRAAAANQVRALVSASTPSVEERPRAISSKSRDLIDNAISAGADAIRDQAEPDDDGYIIGFDFGTSSLKVAYRQPYVAGDPVAVIPVPVELRSAGHPGLWQCVVWYHPSSEEFFLYPVDGAIALDGFKTGLIAGHGDKPMPQAPQVSRAEAATAFLALQLAYVMGAYALTQPLYPVGADKVLLINIGIPVAVRDDSMAFPQFARLVSAAYGLASNVRQLDLQTVKSALKAAAPTLPRFLQLVPELTAAIAGYAADPMVQLGAHILVDVGASTLDIVAFNLQAQLKASVFTAGVDLFGAGALQVCRAANFEDLIFTDACFHLFEDIYGKAKADSRAPSLFKPGRRNMPVQLVITGGGCDTDIHSDFIDKLPRDQVLGAIPLKRPSPPRNILKEIGDRSRLLLAYGLTRDGNELHELRLPSQIPDISSLQKLTISMIDKDMV